MKVYQADWFLFRSNTSTTMTSYPEPYSPFVLKNIRCVFLQDFVKLKVKQRLIG